MLGEGAAGGERGRSLGLGQVIFQQEPPLSYQKGDSPLLSGAPKGHVQGPKRPPVACRGGGLQQ